MAIMGLALPFNVVKVRIPINPLQTRFIVSKNPSVAAYLREKNHRSSSTLVDNSEYTNLPEYPPIIDIAPASGKARAKRVWHDKIHSLNTVEEKLFAINSPKYYGWDSLILKEGVIPYNFLPFTQFVTRTHSINGLPQQYSDPNVEDTSSSLLAEIKPQVEEALVIEYNYRRRKHECLHNKNNDLSAAQLENVISTSIIQQVNRILLGSLSSKYPHLLRTQVDFEPRVESFWFTGGIDPPANVRKSKEARKHQKETANEPVDRCVQYLGSPVIQLRNELPLPQNIPLQEYSKSEYVVPEFTYDPRVLGVEYDHRHGTTIPGFWPGDVSEFGLLSYHTRGHLTERPPHYGKEDCKDCILVQAILASYSWTLSQACYQGFSTFDDITYPLVSQSVITNGQLWSFFSYQLNTTLLHSENAVSNPRRNICWGTNELKLFETVSADKVVGFNDEVLKTLVKFYINEPKVRKGVNMKPYLGQHEQRIADIADCDRRAWLEGRFKHMYSNRSRHRLPYEIYNWERIYKVAHNTRPLEKKTRPFELGENPFARRYDEHHQMYKPKKLRPEDKKNRNKFYKTYHP